MARFLSAPSGPRNRALILLSVLLVPMGVESAAAGLRKEFGKGTSMRALSDAGPPPSPRAQMFMRVRHAGYGTWQAVVGLSLIAAGQPGWGGAALSRGLNKGVRVFFGNRYYERRRIHRWTSNSLHSLAALGSGAGLDLLTRLAIANPTRENVLTAVFTGGVALGIQGLNVRKGRRGSWVGE